MVRLVHDYELGSRNEREVGLRLNGLEVELDRRTHEPALPDFSELVFRALHQLPLVGEPLNDAGSNEAGGSDQAHDRLSAAGGKTHERSCWRSPSQRFARSRDRTVLVGPQ